MIQIKIFVSDIANAIESDVNEFIKDKKVIDIQYQALAHNCFGNNRVMVTYEVEDYE